MILNWQHRPSIANLLPLSLSGQFFFTQIFFPVKKDLPNQKSLKSRSLPKQKYQAWNVSIVPNGEHIVGTSMKTALFIGDHFKNSRNKRIFSDG